MKGDRYERYGRLPSREAGPQRLGQNEIAIVDGRLQMGGFIGPIAPLDERTILILGGPFAGETITRDPALENLYHQGFVYKKIPTNHQAERQLADSVFPQKSESSLSGIIVMTNML